MYKTTCLTFLFCMIFPLLLSAREQGPAMADALRSNGKIYVVVLVLATIFAGIIAFLVHMERRIRRLEKDKHP